MVTPARPLRSVLYMPGSNARALDKARSLPADALILDLEDAVAPDQKDMARDLVCEALATGGYGPRLLMVRVNGLDTPWGERDLAAAIKAAPDAILVPKAGSAAQMRDLEARCRDLGLADATRLWVMIETPAGVLNAAEIAQSPLLDGFVLGTNDLVKDMRAAHVPGRQPVLAALTMTVMAARMAGLAVVDGVYNAFKDDDGLRAECEHGRDLGMDGKTLIHPAQLAIANEVFSPAPEEIERAKAEIAAFDAAMARGEAVAVLNGRIVENLHVETARATLAKSEAIARLSAQT